MIIAIDFDGTCVTHAYPQIGEDIGAVPVLKALAAKGHRLILWTMRSNERNDGTEPLDDAITWFHNHHIPLYGINGNPTQREWTSSPKAYAQLYIDDAALGCPLRRNNQISDRPFVDWAIVKTMMENAGLI